MLAAELLGDKSIYTIGSLTTRFRALHVALGISAAFGAKMAVAVLLGRAISQLPPALVAAVSSLTFLITAILLWRKKRNGQVAMVDQRWSQAASLSFAAIFLTEWADAGQLSTAALTARFGHPLLIWSAATAAMMTKGALAVGVGGGLRHRLPQNSLRYVSVALCVVMAILSAMRVS